MAHKKVENVVVRYIYTILIILSIFDCCVTLVDLYRWPIAAVNIGSSMLHATHCCVPPRYRFSLVLSSVIFSGLAQVLIIVFALNVDR